MELLLKLLEENARLSLEQLATMLSLSEQEVAEKMDKLAKKGVILGYQAVIDWEKTGKDYVTSIIELTVSPQKGHGFDDVAQTIAEFPEVDSVYLMSGGYDLAIIMHGRTFKDIAMFVARRLAPLDSVLSTGTHFVLQKYKDKGIKLDIGTLDERELANL
jgi:Transcriptional regulators